jgi:hypothetical protein
MRNGGMTDRTPNLGAGSITTACDLLNSIESNAELEGLILEYRLMNQVPPGGSRAKTLLNLKRFAVQCPDYPVTTDRGTQTLAAALVDKAIEVCGKARVPNPLFEKLERYLNLDGYAFVRRDVSDFLDTRTEVIGFIVGMPEYVALPESSNEVESLLSANGFDVAKRHLASARDNITQGDWEAANSQCRTFLEALTDAIADSLYGAEAATLSGGLAKRQLLASHGFLSREKHEFGDGPGQTFLPGLAKLLHPDGAHPGISNQDDALFRLQAVVVTARWLLKRHQRASRGQAVI